MSAVRVLIVEDDRDGCLSVAEAIEDLGYGAVTAFCGADGVQALRQQAFDVVLTDLMLPDIDGMEVLRQAREADGDVPVLIMTAYGTVASAVQALKAGAYDYIGKPLDLDDLQSKVARAVETRRLRGEVAELHRDLKQRYSSQSMVARSAAMREIVARIQSLADTRATVLLRGESGTGKEVAARALHVDGSRVGRPFVAVNCGGFSETLLDSELFGHEKGAFTGATQLRKGAFERADGGTLFLDEIGDSPPAVQSRLLRVLEEREIVRLGGHASIPVDVRLVSASNKDLEALVSEGRFREDLFYRLHVVTLTLPPLRERREDIRPLAERFLAAACREHGREIVDVDPHYYDALNAFDWPGNVRQLRNVIEASVLTARRTALQRADLNLPQLGQERREARFAAPDGMTFADMEREILTQTLRRYDGNRTLVAEKLGLSRRTIQRKIQELRLPF